MNIAYEILSRNYKSCKTKSRTNHCTDGDYDMEGTE